MSIEENLKYINGKLGKSTKLIAISKTKPVSLLKECYDAGQRRFGENKVQEMVEKQSQLPSDIEWHLVGHLQTNKVKYIASFVGMIHSVDSLKLLIEINKQAEKHQRIISCLLQIYIAKEETKFGLDETEVIALLNDASFSSLKNIRIAGVMGMATNTDDMNQAMRVVEGTCRSMGIEVVEKLDPNFVAPPPPEGKSKTAAPQAAPQAGSAKPAAAEKPAGKGK